jgi:hypothetical protein
MMQAFSMASVTYFLGVTEIWRQVNENRFECKVTGRKLDRIQFERYQNEKGGVFRFIIEVIS